MHTNSLLFTTHISGILSNTLLVIFIWILREFSPSSKLFLPIWTCPQHRSDVCPQYKAGTSEKVQKTSSLKTTYQKSLYLMVLLLSYTLIRIVLVITSFNKVLCPIKLYKKILKSGLSYQHFRWEHQPILYSGYFWVNGPHCIHGTGRGQDAFPGHRARLCLGVTSAPCWGGQGGDTGNSVHAAVVWDVPHTLI